MFAQGWRKKWRQWRDTGSIEYDLSPYQALLAEINQQGQTLRNGTEQELQAQATALREQMDRGASPEDLLIDGFALMREASHRLLGLRPYDVQVLAGLALFRGRLVELATGEGKTLAAVMPASLHALSGKGVHILTFNDYLARRDAAWMGPVYRFLGLQVGTIQEHTPTTQREQAYRADVTYATAKEAGFDFLRMHLCRSPEDLVHRPFYAAIVDEADSILIDEARVPLVIAGARAASNADPYQIANLVSGLLEGEDWETDEHERNVQLTEKGVDRIEASLACGNLHDDANFLLLTEINQALHARVLLHRDIDYIIRDRGIELVDEFTGRVVDDRRWPDGLQAAVEAKEGLPIQPGGHILGSITLQHFLKQYPLLSGMTATARPAADEFLNFYGLPVVPIPPNTPCIRKDHPDHIFTHQEARLQALLDEIQQVHQTDRPVLVGTGNVEASEHLAAQLLALKVPCRVLNARNNAAEAEIIADAGSPGAVTISTNMAGRGTDIKLGGKAEQDRDRILALGGLYVIGTTRHESRRIDDQLRGRAGRQGDPGSSRFFISLDDPLMVRYGMEHLIPEKLRPSPQAAPLNVAVIRKETARLQRIVEGQNHEIRKTLFRYANLVEKQRRTLQDWRMDVLTGQVPLTLLSTQAPERYQTLVDRFGKTLLTETEQAITLHHIDQIWAEHLSMVATVREGIHLAGIGGLDPLHEFHKQVADAFRHLHPVLEARVVETFLALEVTTEGINLEDADIKGPSATWTYLVNDQVLTDLQQMLFGQGSSAFAAGAALMTWPLLAAWGLWHWVKRRKEAGSSGQ